MNRRQRRVAYHLTVERLIQDCRSIHPGNPIALQRLRESIGFVITSNPYDRDWIEWYMNGEID